jgi:hypothetical protein
VTTEEKFRIIEIVIVVDRVGSSELDTLDFLKVYKENMLSR